MKELAVSALDVPAVALMVTAVVVAAIWTKRLLGRKSPLAFGRPVQAPVEPLACAADRRIIAEDLEKAKDRFIKDYETVQRVLDRYDIPRERRGRLRFIDGQLDIVCPCGLIVGPMDTPRRLGEVYAEHVWYFCEGRGGK